MAGEEVIKLSVEETNKLRAELGLAPLRLNNEPEPPPQQQEQVQGSGEQSTEKEVLEMSVDQTNELRAQLGLKPLRSGTKTEVVHKPAENDGESKKVQERLDRAKLQRDVQTGVSKTFGSSTLADEEKPDALSWADRMRKQQQQQQHVAVENKSKAKKTKRTTSDDNNYGEKELEGLQVTHNMAELEAGSTTVLTLADAPLLETRSHRQVVGLNEGEGALENVNLTEEKKQQDGLRKKRLLEMGLGRAGGYSGFDDEEFEELGGTLGPARKERANPDYESGDEGAPKAKGFRIGAIKGEGDEEITDFDKISTGKAISLQSTKGDVAASDYMTLEEEQEERTKKKKKKDGKFKKKKKEKKEKKKKRSRSKVEDSEDEDDANVADENKTNGHSLLEQLEQTAVENDDTANLRKRRRSESEDETPNSVKQEGTSANQLSEQKRSRYDEIMNKGNERTKLAFQEKSKVAESSTYTYDEEPDDSFLNAALEKARRLNRLKELNQTRQKGAAEAVAAAVHSMKQEEASTTKSSGTLTFAIDDTREFTRAIRARSQQKEREAQKAKQQQQSAPPTSADEPVKQEENPAPEEAKVEDVVSEEEEDVGMEELAREVKADDVPVFGAATADSVGVGRGLASFVSMLKQTGEISTKRGKKEELRGRAKDERNYENYQAMDLSKVVKIGRNATDKDKELAEREIKLEYRDKHGRLLTQKEAFRDLCYQFHGHGASKKAEEKRLKQITREQAEARLASRQVVAARDGTAAGTLGALQATQKATGKAFIVHKT
jgi:U4/U6.U5 tri-snRNP-associated protein 1